MLENETTLRLISQAEMARKTGRIADAIDIYNGLKEKNGTQYQGLITVRHAYALYEGGRYDLAVQAVQEALAKWESTGFFSARHGRSAPRSSEQREETALVVQLQLLQYRLNISQGQAGDVEVGLKQCEQFFQLHEDLAGLAAVAYLRSLYALVVQGSDTQAAKHFQQCQLFVQAAERPFWSFLPQAMINETMAAQQAGTLPIATPTIG